MSHAVPWCRERVRQIEVRAFEKLQKAKALFDSGAISDAEYQELKSKILSGAAM